MKKILLVDDKINDLRIMSQALNGHLNDLEIGDVVETQRIKISDDVNEIEETLQLLNGLMDTIRELLVGGQGLLIVIDLNLISNDEYYDTEKLKIDSTSGIIIKLYIEKNLSDEESANIDFLFISNYLRKDDSVKKHLLSKLSEDNLSWAVKPSLVNGERLAKGELHKCEKKTCLVNIDDNIRQAIQAFYDEETTYGDFIGTILEKAMS